MDCLIFLHIPKTGGISLRERLLARIRPRPTFRILHPIDDHAKLEAMPPQERTELGLVEGHMYHGVHTLLTQRCAYITLLREPLERLHSWHRYVSRERWHPFHKTITQGRLSLADCIDRRLTTEMDNYMTRSLTSLEHAHVPFGAVTREMFELASRNLEAAEFVGTTERLDAFYALLCHRLGWAQSQIGHLNRTRPASAAGKGPQADPRMSRIVRELNSLDYALWERAGLILDSRLREAGLKA